MLPIPKSIVMDESLQSLIKHYESEQHLLTFEPDSIWMAQAAMTDPHNDNDTPLQRPCLVWGCDRVLFSQKS